MEWVEKVWKHPIRALHLIQMVVSELSEYARGNVMWLIDSYDKNREHWRFICSYNASLCEKLNSIAERAKKIYWSCVDDYGLDYYCVKNAGWEALERELKRIAAEALDDIAMLLDEVADALDALCPDLDSADRG